LDNRIVSVLKKRKYGRTFPKSPTQSDTTRATAASGKAGARNSPDKSRVGISKGTGLATEALSLLILSHETMRTRNYKGEAFDCIPTLGDIDIFKNKSGDRTNWI